VRSARPRALVGLVVLSIAVGAALAGAQALAGLPDPARGFDDATVPYSTFLYDRDGRLLSTFEEERRERVTLDEVPPLLQQATIAIEDRTFWTNPGVEPSAVLRALITNWREGRVAQGGSTITQQLVKARLVDDEQTLERKVREALAALNVTLRYPKERILEMYLEQVYYGNRSYGVKTAAKTYFGVSDLWQLTLGQAALLAGLPQRPTVYDPVSNPDGAKARRAEVLAAMVTAGFISAERAAAAAAEPIVVKPAVTPLALPHVVYRVRDELAGILGSERAVYVGGYRVTTTIDPKLQAIAEQMVRERVEALAGSNVHNASLVALDPRTGHILAYVGSVDHADQDPRVRGQFDVAGLGERQVGSTMKLFTYLAAMRRGFTPSSILWDVSTNFAPPGQPQYRPQNASPSGYGAGPENGPVTMRQAIRESMNVPAVKTASLVGVDEIVRTARLLGIEREWGDEQLGLSFALGSGGMTLRELAGAYQVVANAGVRVRPTLIARVEDRSGRVIHDSSRPAGTAAITPQMAWLMSDMLKDTTDPATSSIFGSWTNIGRTAALKTGTTDDLRDVLALGYVPQLLTAVWMGNSDNSEMQGISSAMGPGVLWREFMKAATAHLQLAPEWYARPDGIVERTVCVRPGLYGGVGSGLLPGPGCPASWRTTERYIAGSEPARTDAGVFGSGCINAVAERPEWQADLMAWARAGRTARLGMPVCGFGPRPTAAPTKTNNERDSDRGRGKRGR
jgi:membrane peptidoglycan carboxypeptidase